LAKRSPDRPWFSLVYLSSPGDYQLPADMKGPFQPELTKFNPATAYQAKNLQKLENRYKNTVFYTDQLLEQMLSRSESERGPLKGPIVPCNDLNGELPDFREWMIRLQEEAGY
ncbi:hypothetical protein, partial [Escherichia coli]